MKVYRYLFYDNVQNEFKTVHGTDLYDVNKRAYEVLEYYFTHLHTDAYSEPKPTFIEFCKWHAEHRYGGNSFQEGYVDVIRDDFEVEV